MPYIGHSPTNSGNFYILDDFNGLGQDGGSSTYDQNANGTIVNFKLMVAGVEITPNVDNLIVTIDGVLQHPTDAYTISGSILTFEGAPASGVDFHVVIMGQSSTVGEGSIGADELQVSGDGTNNQLLKSDGDGTFSWINQNTVTASTAATLATARAINGVNFDGSAAITVTAAAGTLSGNTLASGVTASSLTSVGTLTALTGGTGDLIWDSPTFVVDSSANKVGIGTASPETKLHVVGTVDDPLTSGSTSYGTLTVQTNGASLHMGSYEASPWEFYLQAANDSDLSSYHDLLLNPLGGKVGIGTTSISATDWGSASPVVQISGTQPLLSFKETDATKEFQLALSGGAFYLYDADNSATRLLIADDGSATFGTAKLHIDNGGSVGIGTSSPSLNVAGSTGDIAGTVLHIKDTSARADLTLEGQTGARLDLIDITGGSNTKWLRFSIEGDVGKFHSVNDNGAAFNEDNILVMDLASGKVGIGTASLVSELDVYGSTSDGTLPVSLTIKGYNGEYNNSPIGALDFYNVNNSVGSEVSSRIQAYTHSGSATGGFLTFWTRTGGNPSGSLTEKMRIDPTGNVGIGASAPASLLHIESDSDDPTLRITNKTAAAINTGADIEFWNNPFTGSTTNAYESGAIRVRKSNGSNNNHDHYMSFETRKNSVEGINEHMRITSAGRVGIGTTGPHVKLHVVDDPGDNNTLVYLQNTHGTVDDDDGILRLAFSGDADATNGHFIEFRDGNTDDNLTGTISCSSGTATNNTVSDYRTKENISLITGGLEKINDLKPSYFNYTRFPDKVHQGFIAHEVQEAGIGYAVRGDKDAVKDNGDIIIQQFAVANIIPQMVSAIQELSAANDALKSRIEALENA